MSRSVWQKGDGSKDVEAKRKELEQKRAAAAPRGAKQFYRVTVKVTTLESATTSVAWRG